LNEWYEFKNKLRILHKLDFCLIPKEEKKRGYVVWLCTAIIKKYKRY
jgi:hypothetical protein